MRPVHQRHRGPTEATQLDRCLRPATPPRQAATRPLHRASTSGPQPIHHQSTDTTRSRAIHPKLPQDIVVFALTHRCARRRVQRLRHRGKPPRNRANEHRSTTTRRAENEPRGASRERTRQGPPQRNSSGTQRDSSEEQARHGSHRSPRTTGQRHRQRACQRQREWPRQRQEAHRLRAAEGGPGTHLEGPRDRAPLHPRGGASV